MIHVSHGFPMGFHSLFISISLSRSSAIKKNAKYRQKNEKLQWWLNTRIENRPASIHTVYPWGRWKMPASCFVIFFFYFYPPLWIKWYCYWKNSRGGLSPPVSSNFTAICRCIPRGSNALSSGKKKIIKTAVDENGKLKRKCNVGKPFAL